MPSCARKEQLGFEFSSILVLLHAYAGRWFEQCRSDVLPTQANSRRRNSKLASVLKDLNSAIARSQTEAPGKASHLRRSEGSRGALLSARAVTDMALSMSLLQQLPASAPEQF